MSNPNSESPFPPVDFSRYVWRPSAEEGKLEREAAGGEAIEDVFSRFNHGEQNLFLGVYATLAKPASPSELLERVRAAWSTLRFQLPTIAAHTEQNAAGFPLMTYRVAKSAADVDAWAQRTVSLVEDTKDLDELRVEIGKKTIPDANGEQTFLYVVPRSPTSVGFLLYTAHVPFDGAGTKIAFTHFLRLFADPKSAGAAPAWGKEGANLLPVASEVLGKDEPREGPKYVQTLGAVMTDLGAAMPRMHGFKKRNIGPGPTRRAHVTLSLDESTKLRDTARSLGLTINHLTHGAVTLICLNDNPPTESTPVDAAFVFYGLVDCRARLDEDHQGSKYPGYCLGMSAIQVPVSLITQVAGEGEKAQLLKAAGAVKEEYVKQKQYPALLAIEAQQVDMMLEPMRTGGGPPPPWMGPWFAGDGIGETYLEPSYADGAVNVDDFFTSLNKTDPGPFFRSYSWGGKLTLSADYNENAMPREAAEGFVKKWAQILRLLL